jgi:hypothetical protein
MSDNMLLLRAFSLQQSALQSLVMSGGGQTK